MESDLKKVDAATVFAVSGLIGYILLRFTLPALQIERLIFLACLVTTGLVLMLMHRREKRKPTS